MPNTQWSCSPIRTSETDRRAEPSDVSRHCPEKHALVFSREYRQGMGDRGFLSRDHVAGGLRCGSLTCRTPPLRWQRERSGMAEVCCRRHSAALIGLMLLFHLLHGDNTLSTNPHYRHLRRYHSQRCLCSETASALSCASGVQLKLSLSGR